MTNTIGGAFEVANSRPVDSKDTGATCEQVSTNCWTTKDSTETGKTNLNAFTETPLITWRQELQDPDMSGVIAGGFTEDIIGFFYYNQDPDTNRDDLNTMRFPEAVYPSGRCQSLGQTQTIVDPVRIGDDNVIGSAPAKQSPCSED